MNYYYLAASLPMVSLGREPLLNSGAFRALCEEHLAVEDLAVLAALLDREGQGTTHPFVRAWRDRETRLRNAIVRQRAARLGIDAGTQLRPAEGFDLYTVKAVEEAFARVSPAERELELDRFRWAVLDELGGLNPFALTAVLAYALKLRLAERWSRLEGDEGRRRMDELVRQQAEAVTL